MSFFGAFPVQHSQPVAVKRNFVLHDDKAAKSPSIFLKSLTLYCNEAVTLNWSPGPQPGITP